jgi:hypothetical protein
MNRPLTPMIAAAALLLLSGCATSQRQADLSPRPKNHWDCCCEQTVSCADGCRTLDPADLDDFRPRSGGLRDIRCNQWQTLERYGRRCAH